VHDADGAQHLHRDESPRRVEQGRREQRVPDDCAFLLGDERELVAGAKVVEEIHLAVNAERVEIHAPNVCAVVRQFEPNVHNASLVRERAQGASVSTWPFSAGFAHGGTRTSWSARMRKPT
jgi:hypothetical protein